MTHWMIVEPYAGGHQAYYLECLLRRWEDRTADGRVTVVVGSGFRRWHADFLARVEQSARDVQIVEADFSRPSGRSTSDLIRADRKNGRTLDRLVRKHRPDDVLLMYFDHFQVSLSTGMRFDFPVTLRGIYFRPTFHYGGDLAWPDSLTGKVEQGLKRVLLRSACANPHLKTVFSLDPLACESAYSGHLRCDFVPLPEPSSPLSGKHKPSVSTAVLLLGSLSRLKGLPEFMRAVQQLPEDLARSSRFVLAGPISEDLTGSVDNWLAAAAGAGIRLEVMNRFLADAEVEQQIENAGLIVLPYQRHVGMSNVLVRAARHRRPVIGPRTGLLGALIRRHRLGRAVDTESPKEIADGIESFLRAGQLVEFDAEAAGDFADRNTEEAFADTILDHGPTFTGRQ